MTQTTSAAAYEAIQAKLPNQRARILEFLRERGEQGATDEEITVSLNLRPHPGSAPRRRELLLVGLVEDSGRKRKATTGFLQIVWVAKDCG